MDQFENLVREWGPNRNAPFRAQGQQQEWEGGQWPEVHERIRLGLSHALRLNTFLRQPDWDRKGYFPILDLSLSANYLQEAYILLLLAPPVGLVPILQREFSGGVRVPQPRRHELSGWELFHDALNDTEHTIDAGNGGGFATNLKRYALSILCTQLWKFLQLYQTVRTEQPISTLPTPPGLYGIARVTKTLETLTPGGSPAAAPEMLLGLLRQHQGPIPPCLRAALSAVETWHHILQSMFFTWAPDNRSMLHVPRLAAIAQPGQQDAPAYHWPSPTCPISQLHAERCRDFLWKCYPPASFVETNQTPEPVAPVDLQVPGGVEAEADSDWTAYIVIAGLGFLLFLLIVIVIALWVFWQPASTTL